MRARTALTVASILVACARREQPDKVEGTPSTTGLPVRRAESTDGCPSEDLIEELHAAAFGFQHGSPETARVELARATSKSPSDATSKKLLEQLSEISRRIESDAAWAQRETETVRLELGDWSCLPTAMHDRFHAKLPALP